VSSKFASTDILFDYNVTFPTRSVTQSKEAVKLELEVISQEPRAFVIKNLFSDFEADWIKDIARPALHGLFSPHADISCPIQS